MPARLRGDLPREVWALASVAFAVAVGFGIVAPVIPLFAREFGVGATAAGAVISAFAFMRLVSALGGGRLVDLLGERVVLATGLVVVAVSSLLAGLAQTYLQLLLLRGVGGIGSAMFTVSAIGLLLRVVRPDQRGRAMSLWQGGFLVGGLAGPAVGGVLATISLRAPFFVYAGALGVAAVVAVASLAGTRLREDGGDGAPVARTPLRTALRSRAYQAALVTNLGTGWAVFGIRSSVIPLYVADALGRSPLWVGIGFLVGSGAQALALWPAARVVDTVGRRPAMLAGTLVGTGAVAALALWETLPVFLVAMVAYGAGAAFLGAAPAAVVGDVVQGGRGGTVVATFQMASDLGAVTGPLVAGWLIDGMSFGAAFWATAAILTAGAVLSLRMPETADRGDARD